MSSNVSNGTDRSIWISWYDLPERHATHLAWLHEAYIPGMLKRPGLLWAAHYKRAEKFGGSGPAERYRNDDASVPTGTQFMLLFGGTDARAFGNPAPAQMHEELPKQDRTMLEMRIGERVSIFTEESRVDGRAAGEREANAGLGPCIQLGSLIVDTPLAEQELLAWYTQQRLPSIQTMPGSIGARKLVSVAGWARHGVIYEFTSEAAREKHFAGFEKRHPEMLARTNAVVKHVTHAPGSPCLALRIWPSPK